MKIDTASTEEMAIYTDLHNKLHASGMVTMAALTSFRPTVDNPEGGKIMGEADDGLEMPWGKSISTADRYN